MLYTLTLHFIAVLTERLFEIKAIYIFIVFFSPVLLYVAFLIKMICLGQDLLSAQWISDCANNCGCY